MFMRGPDLCRSKIKNVFIHRRLSVMVAQLCRYLVRAVRFCRLEKSVIAKPVVGKG
jgi:hypothetical protein